MYWRGSASRFPRGEAVAKNGSSEPFLVTEEECGQKRLDYTHVRASSRTLDIAVPLPALNPSLRSGGPPINYGVIATGNHWIYYAALCNSPRGKGVVAPTYCFRLNNLVGATARVPLTRFASL